MANKYDKLESIRTYDEWLEEIAALERVEDKNLELSGQSHGVQGTKEGSTEVFKTREGEREEGTLCGPRLEDPYADCPEFEPDHYEDRVDPFRLFPSLSVQRSIRERLESAGLTKQGLIKSYYIVSTINHCYWAKPEGERDRSMFVPLDSRLLRKPLNSRYVDWIRLLSNEGIIERDESYQVGKGEIRGKCKGFKIHPDFAHGTCDTIVVTEPDDLAVRILDQLEEARNRELESVGHELVRRNTFQLRIHDPTASLFRLYYLRQSVDERSAGANQGQTQNIRALADGFRPYKPTETNSAWCKVDAYGRFYSPFVNLFREGRADVTLNREHLSGIDIHASHWFHALMLWPDRDCAEGKELVSSLVDGDFYEFLLAQDSIPWTSRDELKEPSLAFLHSHPAKMSSAAKVVREAIQNVAPQFLAWLEAEKGTDIRRNSHKEFSHRLMREESNRVIVDTVGDLAKIDPEYPVVTIHDAIYVPHSRAAEAKAVFEEVYRRTCGVVPRMKIESTEGNTVRLEDRWSFLPGSTAEKAA